MQLLAGLVPEVTPASVVLSRSGGRRCVWLAAISRNAGVSTEQRGIACGQRGWKWQPDGGSSGLGISPLTAVKRRLRASIRGTSASKRLRVGMVGAGEDFLGRRGFHDPAEIHDHDAVRQVLDDAKVVTDEQVGQIKPRTQIHEQVQDLRLDRDIQRRDGFIADQEFRLHRKGAGDADALALAAGELMRDSGACTPGPGRPGAVAHPDSDRSPLG